MRSLRSLIACSSLPPEGAAAPAECRSPIRGPCLKKTVMPRALAGCGSLPLTDHGPDRPFAVGAAAYRGARA